MYQSALFSTFARLSTAPAGLFSRSPLRGTQGARLYATAQVWVPAGLRGACPGRSKSRDLAINQGIAFRGARAEQYNGKPVSAIVLRCCKGQQHGNNNRFDLSSVLQLRTLLSVCRPLLYVCTLLRMWGNDVYVYTLYVCSLYMCACVWVCSCVTYASARWLRVGKDTHARASIYIFIFPYLPEPCLQFRPLIGTASFCSTPSLVIFSSTSSL